MDNKSNGRRGAKSENGSSAPRADAGNPTDTENQHNTTGLVYPVLDFSSSSSTFASSVTCANNTTGTSYDQRGSPLPGTSLTPSQAPSTSTAATSSFLNTSAQASPPPPPPPPSAPMPPARTSEQDEPGLWRTSAPAVPPGFHGAPRYPPGGAPLHLEDIAEQGCPPSPPSWDADAWYDGHRRALTPPNSEASNTPATSPEQLGGYIGRHERGYSASRVPFSIAAVLGGATPNAATTTTSTSPSGPAAGQRPSTPTRPSSSASPAAAAAALTTTTTTTSTAKHQGAAAALSFELSPAELLLHARRVPLAVTAEERQQWNIPFGMMVTQPMVDEFHSWRRGWEWEKWPQLWAEVEEYLGR